MKIYYIANMRFPNEKAHGKQVREMCNALAEYAEVELIVPSRKTEGDARTFGLHKEVVLVHLGVPDLVRFGPLGFRITAFCFALRSGLYMAVRRKKDAAVLTREYLCAILPALFGTRVAWESHRGEWNAAIRLALYFGARLVVITNGLKGLYMSKGVQEKSIFVAPDGTDLARYKTIQSVSKEAARAKLSLPQDRKIAIYSGHLHTWKGTDTLARAARLLPEHFLVLFVGGTDEDIAEFKKEYGHDARIRILGRRSDEDRPLYLRAADVAVLPNTAKDEISAKYTSPLKLFDYMAAGTPIVASDLPSIREVLSEKTAYFAVPDDAASFVATIVNAAEHPEEALEKASAAQNVVQNYDWKDRARRILGFLAG